MLPSLRALAALALCLLIATAGHAQSSCGASAELVYPFQAPRDCVDVPARGSASTFDVASWNVVVFGDDGASPNDLVQLDRVAAVIAQSEIDVWAMQEIVDESDFEALVDSLAGAGYAGALAPGSFQRLGFLYDADVVTVTSLQQVLESESYAFAGRPPYELRALVSVGGETADVRVLNIHAKAFSDQTSYERRVDAARALKEYTDARVAEGATVLIAGDFNDFLTGSTRGGGAASPYAPFLGDADYGAATLATEEAGLATFCGSDDACTGASTIDHILYSAPSLRFLPDDANAQRQRYGELLDAIGQYTATTSDHLPVVARFALQAVAAADGPEAGPVALLPAAPAPFRDATRLRFRLDAPADVRLEVFDALGRRVASIAGPFGAGAHEVPLDGRGLAPGPYVVRLATADGAQSRVVVRTR